ncbi:HEPN domain-containing protein [Thermus thermophilus]|uniref:HEPN domain-containing protein n=1 Tax=Thermus thermophilus TaxID=274 RepID=A0AAD1KVW3_THETH|nr:HEPN domain-containing protein [Thermus thermophilus]BCZ87941.1 HEPN domain-containing protein [Thermus thermophilus]
MRPEAENLLAQAREDLITAKVLLDAGRYYATAFFAQQAAEKALKALALERLRTFPRPHDLIALAETLGAPEGVVEAARLLTPDYTVSRYPDAAGTLPARLYGKNQAQARWEAAQEVLRWVETSLGT